MKLYTKTGDKGETGLIGGKRVSKADSRISLYGQTDELNAYIGSLRSSLKESQKQYDELLKEIQNNLFNLGSRLACEPANREKFKLPKLSQESLERLEKAIDEIQGSLPKLQNFILPGGAEASSRSHICRVVTRKVERNLVRYEEESKEDLPENSLVYINRLSDFFFSLSRSLNALENVTETIWQS